MKFQHNSEQRCLQLIKQSQDARPSLVGFAKFLLSHAGLSNVTGEDVVQDAICAVLSGLETGPKGRHPRPGDLFDEASFIEYLRGVIKSIVSNESCRPENRQQHYPLDSHEGHGPTGDLNGVLIAQVRPDEDIVFIDLRNELFTRLEARCPDRLRTVLDGWKDVAAWTDSIPINGRHRRTRAEIRALAKRIITNLL